MSLLPVHLIFIPLVYILPGYYLSLSSQRLYIRLPQTLFQSILQWYSIGPFYHGITSDPLTTTKLKPIHQGPRFSTKLCGS